MKHGGKEYFIFLVDIDIYSFDGWCCCNHGDPLNTEKDKEERPKFMGPDDITDQLNYPSLETRNEELLVI